MLQDHGGKILRQNTLFACFYRRLGAHKNIFWEEKFALGYYEGIQHFFFALLHNSLPEIFWSNFFYGIVVFCSSAATSVRFHETTPDELMKDSLAYAEMLSLSFFPSSSSTSDDHVANEWEMSGESEGGK